MNQTGVFIFIAVVIAFTIAGLLPGTKYTVEDGSQAQPFSPSELVKGNDPFQQNLQIDSFKPLGEPVCRAGGKLAVSLLLDTSSSMTCANSKGSRCKIEALKDAVTNFSKGLSDDTVVGVQTLERNYLNFSKFSDVKTTFEQSIKRIPMGGGTPTEKGLTISRDQIRAAKTQFPDYTNWVLVLLTDGCPNNKEKPLIPAADIKASGVRIVTIGLELGGAGKCDKLGGYEGAKELMEKISSAPKDYVDAESDNLTEKFTELVSGVNNCGTVQTQVAACIPTKKAINLLVDTSGSMENNIPYLRTALKEFGGNLDPNLVVGMQDFSDGEPPRTSAAREKYAISKFNSENYNKAVDRLPASDDNGWTHMKDGFNFAKSKIDSNNLVKDYKDWLFVFLSDGKPETSTSDGAADPNQDPSSIANDLKSKGIQIVTIALGNKADKGLMEKLASNGQYKVASDGAALQQVYRDIYKSSLCGQ